MKPKAVLFNLWNKHYPVIKAFAESRLDHLILVQHPAFRNFPSFASFSGRIIPYEQFVGEEEKAAFSMQALDHAAFLGDLASKPFWKEFCRGLDVPSEATAETLFRDAGPKLLEQILQIECLERACEALDIRAAVLNEENTLLPKSMVVWAKSRGIPVLHINHSLGMSGWYTVHGKIAADALAVYGPIVADGPMETGFTGDRVFISGNPDWLVYGNAEAHKPAARAEMAARLFPGPAAPMVVFGTTFAANLTATEEKKDTSASATAFFRAIAALRKTGRRIHAVVKLRPNNDKSFEEEYLRLAAAEGLAPGDFAFVRADLEKLLLAADAIVSVDSTLSADALLADTLAINLITEEGWRRGPYYPGYTGILECRNEDLAACLLDALENGTSRERLRVLRKRSRSAFQGGRKGQDPTAYLADLISQMARRSPNGAPEGAGDGSSGPGESPWARAASGSRESIDLGGELESSLAPEALLKDAARVLTAAGELSCTIRNVSHAPVLRNLIEGTWAPTGGRGRIRFFTLLELQTFLAKAGFTVVSSRPVPGDARPDPALLGFMEAARGLRGNLLEHAGIESYAIKARKAPGGAESHPVPAGGNRKPLPAGAGSMTVLVRPAEDLRALKEVLTTLALGRRLRTEFICMVPAGRAAEAKSVLQGVAAILETEERSFSRPVLESLARSMEGDCAAFLDPMATLGSGWDAGLARHSVAGAAVGPLINLIAGTQSVYHYLSASRIDPDDVESLAREVRMRYPAMSLAADWLYEQILVVGRDMVSALSRMPDRKPDAHFLGLGEKLRRAGARLLVAKDVYARLEG